MNSLAVSHISEASVSIVPDAIATRDAAVEWADMIDRVESPEQQAEAVKSQRELAALIKSVEAEREHVKRPVRLLGTEIDNQAKLFVAPMIAQANRLGVLVSKYQAEQERIRREAEAARQAAIRKAEADARASAEAEQARLRAEQRAAEEAAAKERNAAKSAELLRVAQQRKLEQEAAARNADATVAQASQAAAATVAVVVPAVRAPGQTVRTVPKFEVLDAAIVYASRPELCRIEVMASAVNRVLAAGERSIPGLRIWEETVSGVRV